MKEKTQLTDYEKWKGNITILAVIKKVKDINFMPKSKNASEMSCTYGNM